MSVYYRKILRKTEKADYNWTYEEDNILLNNYQNIGYREVNKLVGRTPKTCCARIYHLRKRKGNVIKKCNYPEWTKREIIFLKRNYPDKGGEWNLYPKR